MAIGLNGVNRNGSMYPNLNGGAGMDSSSGNEKLDQTDGVQLTKLSSVLNGLESGAAMMRRQAQQVLSAVRSGTYRVDPMNLSKRIVRDSFGAA